LQTLIDRSPFSPPAGHDAVENAAAEQSVLEFRGMVVDAGGTAYSVFDATANKARWLRVGEGESFKVKQYDAASSQLEIEQNGKTLKLSLKRATIAAGPAVVMNPTPAPQQPNGAANARPGDPVVDAKRLETVAAEVRRRRALRSNPPPPAANAPAAPAPAAKPNP
jgi:hypothetical protein